MRKYFYRLLYHYLAYYITPQDTVIDIDPPTDTLIKKFSGGKVLSISENTAVSATETGKNENVNVGIPGFFLLSGNIHVERDIQTLLERLYQLCSPNTRVIINYYSSLWKPLIRLATRLGIRSKTPEENWLAPEDIGNLLLLADFEIVQEEGRVLLPIYIPVISALVNRYLAPLPFFRHFCLLNILVARPKNKLEMENDPSVSVIVAARNEEGNIQNIIDRLPQMGPDDELIFVEGHSTDKTWEKIQEVCSNQKKSFQLICAQQDGKGKGDAVRKGFSIASKDILMILDADLTVPPEDLPKFYEAIKSGKGEFINGTRLVYPMEKRAMRFLNMLGNKFFAVAFSFVLGQRFRDTLCGTKVISRSNYEKLADNRSYFGEFDPFGDFDLIFGAARMGLKIVEVPIVYQERTYGTTNISRWSHGLLLLRMLFFAARKIRFI